MKSVWVVWARTKGSCGDGTYVEETQSKGIYATEAEAQSEATRVQGDGVLKVWMEQRDLRASTDGYGRHGA